MSLEYEFTLGRNPCFAWLLRVRSLHTSTQYPPKLVGPRYHDLYVALGVGLLLALESYSRAVRFPISTTVGH